MIEMPQAGPLLSSLEEKALATRERVTALAASAVRDGRKRASGFGASVQHWVERFQRDAGELAARVQRDGAEGLAILEKRSGTILGQGRTALDRMQQSFFEATGVATQAEVRELARSLRNLARRVEALEHKRPRKLRAHG